MIKKVSSMMMLGACLLMLHASMLPANDTEKNKEQAENTIVGNRAESTEVRNAQLAKRAKMIAEEESAELAKTSKAAANSKLLKGVAPMAAKSIYYALHPATYQHSASISFFGDMVELMDGSVWDIAYSDTYKTAGWFLTDLIVITPNHSWFSSYGFRLTNQSTGESVAANLSLGPIAPNYYSVYTHWIVAIDYIYNIVYLEDGTSWHMSAFDDSIVNQWVAGDVVIVGVNDGWLSSSKPNVLINVAMLNYAAGVSTF